MNAKTQAKVQEYVRNQLKSITVETHPDAQIASLYKLDGYVACAEDNCLIDESLAKQLHGSIVHQYATVKYGI